MDRIRQKVKSLQAKVFQMICDAQQILARLDEITLRPNPLTELDCIDLLIVCEKAQCKPSYRKRLEYLQDIRRNVEFMYQINVIEGDGDAPKWLKNVAEKTKQTMKQKPSKGDKWGGHLRDRVT